MWPLIVMNEALMLVLSQVGWRMCLPALKNNSHCPQGSGTLMVKWKCHNLWRSVFLAKHLVLIINKKIFKFYLAFKFRNWTKSAISTEQFYATLVWGHLSNSYRYLNNSVILWYILEVYASPCWPSIGRMKWKPLFEAAINWNEIVESEQFWNWHCHSPVFDILQRKWHVNYMSLSKTNCLCRNCPFPFPCTYSC